MARNGKVIAIRVCIAVCVSMVVVVASVVGHAVYAQSRQALTPSPAANQANGACLSWQVSPGQNPGSGPQLADVAAISSGDIWAVGGYDVPNNKVSPNRILFEHFNGHTWSVVPSPNPGPAVNDLRKLSVVSSSDIWAVGSEAATGNGLDAVTLIEHWDGNQWSVVPSPNGNDTSTGNNILTGVAAVSADNIWAVGYYYLTNGNLAPLVEHWNGASWTLMNFPAVSPYFTVLNAVTAISASDLWVAGNYQPAKSLPEQPLFAHWNGTSWTVVPATTPGFGDPVTEALSALSDRDIWAVGWGYHGGTTLGFFTDHWDGTSWSVVPITNSATVTSVLYGVVALASNDVWTVGYYLAPNANERSQVVIMHWNGSAWTILTPASLGSNSGLVAIFALSAKNLWSVGWTVTTTTTQVFIAHATAGKHRTCRPKTLGQHA